MQFEIAGSGETSQRRQHLRYMLKRCSAVCDGGSGGRSFQAEGTSCTEVKRCIKETSVARLE